MGRVEARLSDLRPHAADPVHRAGPDDVVRPLPDHHHGPAIDRDRQHQATAVVDVVADEVHPAGGEERPDGTTGGDLAELPLEGVPHLREIPQRTPPLQVHRKSSSNT